MGESIDVSLRKYFDRPSSRRPTFLKKIIQDKLDGKKVHINRMILVDQKYRNHGLGTFLLKNSIDDAVRDGCDAFYYPVAGPAAIKCADRLKLVTQNALDISEEEPEFKGNILNAF